LSGWPAYLPAALPADQASGITNANWPGKQAYFWPTKIEFGSWPGNGGIFMADGG